MGKVISRSDLVFCSYDLPADVFEPGEVRPTRPKKILKRAEPLVKKRKLDTIELEVSSLPLDPEIQTTRSWTSLKLDLAFAACSGKQTGEAANLPCLVRSCRNPHRHKTVQNDSVLLIWFGCIPAEEAVSTSSAAGTSIKRSCARTVLESDKQVALARPSVNV